MVSEKFLKLFTAVSFITALVSTVSWLLFDPSLVDGFGYLKVYTWFFRVVICSTLWTFAGLCFLVVGAVKKNGLHKIQDKALYLMGYAYLIMGPWLAMISRVTSE